MSWLRSLVVFVLLAGISGAVVEAATASSWSDASESFAANKDRDKLVQELDLTPFQIQQLKTLRQKYKGIKERKAAFVAAKKELESMERSNAPANQIQEKRHQVRTLQQQWQDLRSRNLAELREILNADQWAKLQKMREQRRNERGGSNNY